MSVPTTKKLRFTGFKVLTLDPAGIGDVVTGLLIAHASKCLDNEAERSVLAAALTREIMLEIEWQAYCQRRDHAE